MRRHYLFATLAVITPGLASARPSPSPDKARIAFDKADTNHDGLISLDEWKAAGRRERGFKIVDADGDGKVTPAELKAALAKYGRGG